MGFEDEVIADAVYQIMGIVTAPCAIYDSKARDAHYAVKISKVIERAFNRLKEPVNASN